MPVPLWHLPQTLPRENVLFAPIHYRTIIWLDHSTVCTSVCSTRLLNFFEDENCDFSFFFLAAQYLAWQVERCL